MRRAQVSDSPTRSTAWSGSSRQQASSAPAAPAISGIVRSTCQFSRSRVISSSASANRPRPTSGYSAAAASLVSTTLDTASPGGWAAASAPSQSPPAYLAMAWITRSSRPNPLQDRPRSVALATPASMISIDLSIRPAS